MNCDPARVFIFLTIMTMKLTVTNYNPDHVWAIIVEQWKHHQFKQFSGINTFCLEIPKGTRLTRSSDHLKIHLPPTITSLTKTYLITDDDHFQVDNDLSHIYERCSCVRYSSYAENGYIVMMERDIGNKPRWYGTWSKIVKGNGLSLIYSVPDIIINYLSVSLVTTQ